MLLTYVANTITYICVCLNIGKDMRGATKLALFLVFAALMLSECANAESLVVSPGNQTVPYEPDFATYTLHITGIVNTTASHNISTTIYTNPPGSSKDIEFRFENPRTGAYSEWMISGEKWNWGTPFGDAQILKMYVRAKSSAPRNHGYTLWIEDRGGDIYGATEFAVATSVGETIPEFQAIAIPLGISLFLALFFFRKKQKG